MGYWDGWGALTWGASWGDGILVEEPRIKHVGGGLAPCQSARHGNRRRILLEQDRIIRRTLRRQEEDLLAALR